MWRKRNLLICLTAVTFSFVGIEAAPASSDWDYCVLLDCYMDNQGVFWLFWLDCYTMSVFEERVDLQADSTYALGHEGEALAIMDQQATEMLLAMLNPLKIRHETAKNALNNWR